MISLSDTNVSEIRRLLAVLMTIEGYDNRTRNIRRRASILYKKLGAKEKEQQR